MTARDRLIVALDFPDRISALAMVDLLEDRVLWYKVGLQLFTAEGPVVLDDLRRRGKQVFLDLKLHDIPNTVSHAVRAVAAHGASLLTIHASGGRRMLEAAGDAAKTPGAPKLLAVTVLTSLRDEDLQQTGVSGAAEQQVGRLAELAVSAGIPGLVCSSQEVASLRQRFGPDLLLVVPGIRSGAAADDQQRTSSAAEAILRGASTLVVGRPIIAAPDPGGAVEALLHEITQAMERVGSTEMPGA